MRAGAMGGLRHHLIGGFGIAEVEKLSRKCATFAPPFIRVLANQLKDNDLIESMGHDLYRITATGRDWHGSHRPG